MTSLTKTGAAAASIVAIASLIGVGFSAATWIVRAEDSHEKVEEIAERVIHIEELVDILGSKEAKRELDEARAKLEQEQAKAAREAEARAVIAAAQAEKQVYRALCAAGTLKPESKECSGLP
jgi:hypothetical protein